MSYPNGRNSTSFSKGSSLRPGRSDYSAVRVNPDYDRAGVALLRTTVTYTNCGWHDRPLRSTSVVTLPVRIDNAHGGNNGHGSDNGHSGHTGQGGDTGQSGHPGQGGDTGQGGHQGQGGQTGQGTGTHGPKK